MPFMLQLRQRVSMDPLSALLPPGALLLLMWLCYKNLFMVRETLSFC